MTTPETEAAQTDEDASIQAAKPEDAKGLRKQLAEAHKDLAEANAKILTPAYEKLGLNPELGLGKAIAKEYDGPASFEGLAEFAQTEYGHVAPDVEPDAHPQAEAIHTETDKLEQVAGAATSVVPATQGTELQKAEADGNYQTTLAIKGQQLAEMLKP